MSQDFNAVPCYLHWTAFSTVNKIQPPLNVTEANMDPFREFIPGIKTKPGNAGLSAKEIRDRKRRRLEREQELQNNNDAKQPTAMPCQPATREGEDSREDSLIDLKCEISFNRWILAERERLKQSKGAEGILQNRAKSMIEERRKLIASQSTVQKLKLQVESFQQEEKEISDNQSSLQTQIKQLEVRHAALKTELERGKAELRMEEKQYAELGSDLAATQESLGQVKTRQNAIKKAKQKKRIEMLQLQKIVDEMRDEATQSENQQSDFIKEIEARKKELESQRDAFASAIRKANSGICRLRETIETLKESKRKEASVHATTLSAADRTFITAKVKLDDLASDNSCTRPSAPPSELKTIYWSPTPKSERKKRARSLISSPDRQEIVKKSECKLVSYGRIETSESSIVSEPHATPVPTSHSRRASFAHLNSKVDSLSRIESTRLVDNRKSSPGEKRHESSKVRKQLIIDAWGMDSLAGCSMEKKVPESSPRSLTYMGHEILRKYRRRSSSD